MRGARDGGETVQAVGKGSSGDDGGGGRGRQTVTYKGTFALEQGVIPVGELGYGEEIVSELRSNDGIGNTDGRMGKRAVRDRCVEV